MRTEGECSPDSVDGAFRELAQLGQRMCGRYCTSSGRAHCRAVASAGGPQPGTNRSDLLESDSKWPRAPVARPHILGFGPSCRSDGIMSWYGLVLEQTESSDLVSS